MVARSVAIDAMLLAAGIGMFLLRRWAAAVFCIASVFAAFGLGRTSDHGGLVLFAIFLIPSLVTVWCWGALRWGDKRRDLLVVLASLIASGALHVAAFMLHHSR